MTDKELYDRLSEEYKADLALFYLGEVDAKSVARKYGQVYGHGKNEKIKAQFMEYYIVWKNWAVQTVVESSIRK